MLARKVDSYISPDLNKDEKLTITASFLLSIVYWIIPVNLSTCQLANYFLLLTLHLTNPGSILPRNAGDVFFNLFDLVYDLWCGGLQGFCLTEEILRGTKLALVHHE